MTVTEQLNHARAKHEQCWLDCIARLLGSALSLGAGAFDALNAELYLLAANPPKTGVGNAFDHADELASLLGQRVYQTAPVAQPILQALVAFQREHLRDKRGGVIRCKMLSDHDLEQWMKTMRKAIAELGKEAKFPWY